MCFAYTWKQFWSVVILVQVFAAYLLDLITNMEPSASTVAPKTKDPRLNPNPTWEFPKIRGALFWGPSNKDPSILGYYLGVPYLWKLPLRGHLLETLSLN